MSLLISGATGRNAEIFEDPTGGPIAALRVISTGLPQPGVDISFRRNPLWYTLGHISLCLNPSTVYFETFVNFEDQFFSCAEMASTLASFSGELGEPDYTDPDLDWPLVVRWDIRDGVSWDIYIAT